MSTSNNPNSVNIYSLGSGTVSSSVFGQIIVSPVGPGNKVIGPNGPMKLGQLWLDSENQTCHQLTRISGSAGVISGTWTVLGGSSSDVNTLTGNTGGAISPTGGNINVVGTGDVSVAGVGSTLTISVAAGEDVFPTTPYTVGPVGKAAYQTIQAAIEAANMEGGGVVYVQPGTYTENLIIYTNISIISGASTLVSGGATIVGTHTPPDSGTIVFQNLNLKSATNVISRAAAGTTNILLKNITTDITDGYLLDLENWTSAATLELWNVSSFYGALGTNDGVINNTGGAKVNINYCYLGMPNTNAMIVSGDINIYYSTIFPPIDFQTGASVSATCTTFFSTCTFSNDSTGQVDNSSFESQVVMNSSGQVSVVSSTINRLAGDPIIGTGVGSFYLGDITFINNDTIGTVAPPLWLPSKFGNIGINGVGSKLSVQGGAATDFIGTGTLTNGTVTIANTNISASDRIFITRTAVNASTALGEFLYTISAGAHFVVTSINPASPAATETNDQSSFVYFIVRETS